MKKEKKTFIFLTVTAFLMIKCHSNTVDKNNRDTVKSFENRRDINIQNKQPRIIHREVTIPDTVNINNIRVKKTSTSSIRLMDSITVIATTFGAPDSTYSEYWEMDEKNALVYLYNGSKFFFLDDKLVDYEINGADFLVGSASGPHFKIGDNISSVSTYLPNYISTGGAHHATGVLSENGILYDCFIGIDFNPSTRLITKITTGSY